MSEQTVSTSPGLARQLAAILYDALVILALWFALALPIVLVLGGPPASALARGVFQAYLIAVAFGFFGYFWVHGGQTIGMRAWRLILVADCGAAIGWQRAAIRFAVAGVSGVVIGLGFLWRYVDPQRRSWHDHASGSHLVLLPKPPR